MRILFVLNTLAMGGAERVGALLCNAWAAQGNEVMLVQSFSGGAKNFFTLDAAIYQEALGSEGGTRNPLDILKRINRLRRLTREFQPDVVISFLTNVNLLMLVATVGLGMRRIVCERADPISMPLTKIMRSGVRMLYRYANLVVVQTRLQGERLESLYGSMPHLSIIANPLSENLPKPSLRGPNSPHRIVSLGRLAPEKRVDRVITAFHRLASDRPDWELYIYGDGPSLASLQQRASIGPAAGRIHFPGPTDQALKVLADASIFTLCSDFEGFPHARMEAMALGLPSVSTDCPCGPREMTNNGQAGLLVPVDDKDAFAEALARLMDDEALRRSLGDKAASHINLLCSREVILAKWQEAFSRVGVV
jgi:GalNAc-alpha-(1->4)-GalNAc-alpha-(1->3)-diNAcBac-PP-undecaprenol alpha-1,4-N-acetyl-D-galactosaminyltransferase